MSAFCLLFSLMAFFVPSVTVGTVPVPLIYGLSVLYLLIQSPKLPSRQLAIFSITVIYLSIIAAKNAVDDRGDFRDFLYLFICFGQLTTFSMLKDIFDRRQ